MIEFTPTLEQIGRAWVRTDEVLTDEKKSIEKFGSRPGAIFRGFIGEEMFLDYWPGSKLIKNYNYDIITVKDKKLDVKTIKCAFKPHEHYMVNVQSPDLEKFKKDPPDYFVFFRIKENLSKAWLVGYKKFDEFIQLATFYPIGTKRGEITFTGDTWELPISKLDKFREV